MYADHVAELYMFEGPANYDPTVASTLTFADNAKGLTRGNIRTVVAAA